MQELDQKICNNIVLSEQTLNEYGDAKCKLQEIYEKKGREAMFRSKVEWVEKGEKPTKYSFNLERKKYEKKTILQLKIGDNEVTSEFAENKSRNRIIL